MQRSSAARESAFETVDVCMRKLWSGDKDG